MDYSMISDIIGKENVYKKIHNPMDLIEISNSGVNKSALIHLAKNLSLTMKQMAALLPITERTIQRYAKNKHLNQVVSEQILQIAEVVVAGIKTFGSQDKFIQWMNHPIRAFKDKKPISFLSSRFGVQIILDEFGRIEHGIFS